MFFTRTIPFLRSSLAGILLLLTLPVFAMVNNDCIDNDAWVKSGLRADGSSVLHRSFQPSAAQLGMSAHQLRAGHNALTALKAKYSSEAKSLVDTLEISYDDFLLHMTPGLFRYSFYVKDSLGILEDVGMNGVLNGRWVVPDFDQYTYTQDRLIIQLEPDDTEGHDVKFPDATHAFYDTDGRYQFFSLYEEDYELTFLGLVRADGSVYEGGFTQSPVPLRQGLGEFGGEQTLLTCEESRTGCDNFPTAEFIIPEQLLLELASGVMVTPEDGEVPAIKARSMEVLNYYSFDDATADFVLVGSDTIFKLEFYSVGGHRLIGVLADGYTFEDSEVVFAEIYYQQLESGVLPVSWGAVSASVLPKNDVAVNWSVAAVENNAGFTVERSADGLTFNAIGEVADRGSADYAFTDEAALEGVNYYRVRQTDHDGTATYSTIVSVLLVHSAIGEEVAVLYPNPGRDEVYFSRPVSYELSALDGRVLSAGQAEQQVDVSALPAGTYLVRIDGGEAHRWVKQ